MKKSIFILLVFVSILFSQEVLVGGYLYTDEGDYDSSAPLAHSDVWKCFSFVAETTLAVDKIRIRLGGFAGSPETDNDVGFVVFKFDKSDSTCGLRMFSGYELNYDWTVIGTNANHEFDISVTYTTTTLQKDSAYFVAFEASGCENLLIARGRAAAGDTSKFANHRWGTNQDVFTNYAAPPDSADMLNGYEKGFYAWALMSNVLEESLDNNLSPGNRKVLPGNSKAY